MNEHSDDTPDWESQRNRIIGLGETSIRKSYYPELQQRIHELEKKNQELRAAYEEMTATDEELRHQIEEIAKKEQELRASQQRFHSLYANMIDGAAIHELKIDQNGIPEDYIITEINPAFEKHLGISRERAVGKTSREVYGVESPPFLATYARVVQTGKPEVFETYFPPLGKYFQIAVYCPATGTFATIFEDITERKLAEETLRESEEFLSGIVENIPLMIFVKDAKDLRFVRFNRAGEELLGYSREELLGKNDYDFFPKDQADFFSEKDRAVLTGKVRIDIPEEPIVTRILGERTLHTRKIPVLDSNGEPRFLLGISEDITEQKEAEASLRDSEERYRSLVDITDTGYLVLDNRGLVIDANEVYLRLIGRASLAEILGHPVTEWTATHDSERNAREVEKCLKTGHVRGLEVDYLRPDGSLQPVEINATVFHAAGGDIVLTLCRDISDRKRTNTALQQARNKLALLNAVTFQDIQTAAFSLAAYQELVKAAVTDQKARSYIEKQEVFLKKMVDTLDFAKNYQEMGIHPPRWQNVRQVFLFAISHLDFLHMKQNLHLANLEIFADPLFEKALFNIMQNVLEHGARATEVTLHFVKHPESLVLIIEDNGVGIPPEEKNMIFDRGYGKGSGLGLFLVREVLSITGMSIREAGSGGQGTRFEITVPKGGFRNP
ncbi:MAG: hypothetical protein CVV32_02790 [Methanomicrobiales archaeon HGW-Methanomicrobiales-3]|jgi:PAS domain S-box-containing protein|nr:MAG: hypothetical protein CVV32_02790 [Methanomicrobiales archaeon HGW-Methanomicrobiales-3]